jgi:hypothetical protein
MVVSATTNNQAHHLRECATCRHHRRKLTRKWAELNLWLVAHDVPTKRSKSVADFKREITERFFQKVKVQCEEALAALDAADVIKKRGNLQDNEFHDMFFSHVR